MTSTRKSKNPNLPAIEVTGNQLYFQLQGMVVANANTNKWQSKSSPENLIGSDILQIGFRVDFNDYSKECCPQNVVLIPWNMLLLFPIS